MTTPDSADHSPSRIARCPQCGASTRLDSSNRWRPFCCERCKLIDLGDWLNGRYALPVTQPDHSTDGESQD